MSGSEDSWRGGGGREGSSFRGFNSSNRSEVHSQGRGSGDYRGGFKQGEGGYRGHRGRGQGGSGSSSGNRRFGDGPPRRYSNGPAEEPRGGSGSGGQFRRDRENDRQHNDYAGPSSTEQRSRQVPASHANHQAFPSLGGVSSSVTADAPAPAAAPASKASGWASSNFAGQLKSSGISSDSSGTPHRSTHANLRAPPPVNLQRQAATQQQNGQEKMQFLTLSRPGQKAVAPAATAAAAPAGSSESTAAAAAVDPASPKAAEGTAEAVPAAAKVAPAAPSAEAAGTAQAAKLEEVPAAAAERLAEQAQPKVSVAAAQPTTPKSAQQQPQQDQKSQQQAAPSVWEVRKAAAATKSSSSSSGGTAAPQNPAPASQAWSKPASVAAPASPVKHTQAASQKPSKMQQQQQKPQHPQSPASTVTSSAGEAKVDTNAAAGKTDGLGASGPTGPAPAATADSWGSAAEAPKIKAAGWGSPAPAAAAKAAAASGWGSPTPAAAVAAAPVAKADGWGAPTPAAAAAAAPVAKADGWGAPTPAAAAAAAPVAKADGWGAPTPAAAAAAAPVAKADGWGTPTPSSSSAAPPVAKADGWGAPTPAAAAAAPPAAAGGVWGSTAPAAAVAAAPKAAWGSGQSLAAKLASTTGPQQQRQQQPAAGTPKAAAAAAGAPKPIAAVLPSTPKATAAATPGTPKGAAAAGPGTPKAAAALPGTPKAATAGPGTPKTAAAAVPGISKTIAVPGTPKASATDNTSSNDTTDLLFGSIGAALVDEQISSEPSTTEQQAGAAVTPAIDVSDSWGVAAVEQTVGTAAAAADAASASEGSEAAASMPAARSWAALAAKAAGAPGPAAAPVQRRVQVGGPSQSHDSSSSSIASRGYGRGSSTDSRDYRRERMAQGGRGGGRGAVGRGSGFGGGEGGAAGPGGRGAAPGGSATQGHREPRVQDSGACKGLGHGLDRQPADGSAAGAEKTHGRHHYSHKAHEHPEDFADSEPQQQQQQQQPMVAAAGQEQQQQQAGAVAEPAAAATAAAAAATSSSNPIGAEQDGKQQQQDNQKQAAADDDSNSIVHPVQDSKKHQEELQDEAEAAAAAASAASEDADTNWDLVDPAALEALRSVVAVLDNAYGLGSCRLQPRGLVNTGNSCFMNCTLQALMAVSPFCSLLQQLARAGPALGASMAPTLTALAQLASEFKPVVPPEPTEEQQGWGEVPKGKRQKAASKASAATASSSNSSSAAPLPPLTAVLGGTPLSPVCMNGTVAKFNPRRAEEQANGSSSNQAASANAVLEQEQEDAQEFLQFLVDAAHEELVNLRSQLPAGQDSSHSSTAPDGHTAEQYEDEEEWSVVTKRNKAAVTRGREDLGGTSILSAIFRGSIKSQVKAKGVKNAAPSITVQPFTMLHLDVLDNVRSIEDALDHMTHAETIHGYKVKGQQGGVEAEKVVKISKLPQVMLLAINRYSWHMDRGSSQKLHHALAYPMALRMKPHWLSDDCPDKRNAQYQLTALVTHHGRNVSGGHYTAHVQQGDGQWMHFNDANVTLVKANQVLLEKPYLLVYQRA